jgi:hypothetical protein
MTILGSEDVLTRLGRESRLSSLAALAVRGADSVQASPFEALTWDELLVARPMQDESDRAAEESRVAAVCARVTGDSHVVVIEQIRAAGDVRELRLRIERAVALIKREGHFISTDSSCWTLVLVAEVELTSDDVDELTRLRELAFMNDRETRVFGSCYLMTRTLGVPQAGGVLFARDVWPIAVGRLLIHRLLSYRHHRPVTIDTDCWLRAWVSMHVTAVPDDIRFEQFILSRVNRAIIPSRAGVRALTHLDAPAEEGALHTTMSMGFVPIETDYVPLAVDALEPSPLTDPGYYARQNESSDQDIGFLDSDASDGVRRFESRCVRAVIGWRLRFSTRSARFRRDRDLRQTRPFGSFSGGMHENSAPTSFVAQAWSAVRNRRWNLTWFCGAQAAEQFEIWKLTRKQELSWRAFLDFELVLSDAASRAREIAKQQDEARSAYISFWMRLAIAIVASLFVGFALSAFIASATGSDLQAMLVAGGAVALGCVLSTVGLCVSERRAGDRGARCLDQTVQAMENGISESLRQRLALVAGGDSLQRKSIWMATSARVRRLAMRAHCIYEAAAEEALKSHRELLDSMRPEPRLAIERYLAATTRRAVQSTGDDESELLRKLELEADRQDSNFAKALIRGFHGMESAWAKVTNRCDVNLQGHLPRRELHAAVFGAASEARLNAEVVASETLLSASNAANALSAHMGELESTAEGTNFLSVRLDGYSTGEGMEQEASRWYAQLEGEVTGVNAPSDPELLRLSGALAIVHREQPLCVITPVDGVARFQVFRENGGAR